MIERGSDIEALLMLCALADPKEARTWLYAYRTADVCPLSSAGNTIAGARRWLIFPSGATRLMGLPEDKEDLRADIMRAADGVDDHLSEIRAALEAMFPKEEV